MFMKWFSLEGRASRKEWWIVTAVAVSASIIVGILVSFWIIASVLTVFRGDLISVLAGLLFVMVIFLGIFAAYYATSIRRYHDRGKSGWWILIALIPVIGGVWQFVELGFLESMNENNPYGINPVSTEEKPAHRVTVGDLASQSAAH